LDPTPEDIILDKEYYSAPISDLKGFFEQEQTCPCCGKIKLMFISPSHNEYPIICTDCLIDKHLVFAHNTEKGLVSKDPILFGQADEFDIRLHVPLESISKLMSTPNFEAPADAPWLICCKDFMKFKGIWTPSHFTEHSTTTGKELFLSMTDKEDNIIWDDLDLVDNEDHYTWEGINYYAFHCKSCNSYRGNWEYLE